MASPTNITFEISPDLVIPNFQDKDRNKLVLTNPGRYGILLYAEHEGTLIYALFPDLDPKDPSSRPTKLCVAPDVCDIDRMVRIYQDLKEIIPPDKCQVEIVHLSEEQLTMIALHDYDQDKLFGFLYDGGRQNNELFEVIVLAEVTEDDNEVRT